MAKTIGKCFICHRDIYQHELAPNAETGESQKAYYYKNWPNDGLLCTDHPGVKEEYQAALQKEEQILRKQLRKKYPGNQ
jgi:hypothetical protein